MVRKNKNETDFFIDFSKMDNAIKKLLDIVSEKFGIFSDKNCNNDTKNGNKKILKKKINVEMIRELLMEAKNKKK